MKKGILNICGVLLGVILIIGSFVCASAAAPTPAPITPKAKLDQLYQAAKAEGKIVQWGPQSADHVKAMGKKFNERYPGIALEYFELVSGDIVTRIVAEVQAGRCSVDVLHTASAFTLPIAERGWFVPYDLADVFNVNPNSMLFNGTTLVWFHGDYPLAYNTKLVRREDLPKNWNDLLDPKWMGKIAVAQQGFGIGHLGIEWGEAKLMAYIDKLMAQKPLRIKGGPATFHAIATGEAAIGIGGQAFHAETEARKGAPVSYIYLDPTAVIQNSVGLLKQALHPNAGKLWMGFLASPEGQRIWEGVGFAANLKPGSGSKAADELAKVNTKLVWIDNPENIPLYGKYLDLISARLMGVVK